MTTITKSKHAIFKFKTASNAYASKDKRYEETTELFVFGREESCENYFKCNGNKVPKDKDNEILENLHETEPPGTPVRSDIPVLYSKFNKPSRTQIEKDLNSPSASCRVRGLQAVRDGLYNRPESDSEDEESRLRALLPKPVDNLNEVLKGVIAYVEVCCDQIDMSDGAKDMLRKMGAIVRDKLLKDVTHIIFKEGRVSTYKKAIERNIHILSILWVEMCRNQMYKVREDLYPPIGLEEYKMLALLNKRSKPMKKFELSHQNSIKKTPSKDNISKMNDSLDISFNNSATNSVNEKMNSKTPEKTHNNKKVNDNNLEVNLMKKFLTSRALNKNKELSKCCEHENLDISANKISAMFSKISVSNKSMSDEISKTVCKDNTKFSKETTSDSFQSDELIYGTISPMLKKRRTFFIPQTKDVNNLVTSNCRQSNSSTDTNATNSESNESIKLQLSISDNSKSTNVTDESIMQISELSKLDSHIFLKSKTLNSSLSLSNGDKIVIAPDSTDINTNSRCTDLSKNHESISSSEFVKELSKSNEMSNNKQKGNNSLFSNISSQEPIKSQKSSSNENNDSLNSVTNNSTPQRVFSHRKSLRIALRASIGSPLVRNIDEKEQNFSSDSKNESSVSIAQEQIDSEKNPDVMLTPRMLRLQCFKKVSDCSNFLNKTNSENLSDDSSATAEINNLSEQLKLVKTDEQALVEIDKENGQSALLDNEKQNASSYVNTPIIARKRKLYTMNDSMNDSVLNDSINIDNQKNDTKDFYINLVQNSSNSKTAKEKTRNARRISLHATNKKPKQNRRITTFFFPESNSAASQTISDSMLKNLSPITAPRRSSLEFKAKPSKQESKPKPNSKILQKSITEIVFTSLHSEQISIVRRVVNKLGGYSIGKIVNANTSHVVAFESRRTLNFLKGIVRGCWIVNFDWILKSEASGMWLDEDLFEWTDFSPAVQKARIERQVFGSSFRLDIFSTCGSIYIGRKCSPPWQDLQELVIYCSGKVVMAYKTADIVIGEKHDDFVCVLPTWILDSITNGKVKSINDYITQ